MLDQLPAFFSLAGTQGAIILQLLVVWSLVWKGFALWQAARVHKRWFIALLIINSAGIVEIIYLLFYSPKPYFPTLKKRFNR
ncbi:hypothetical protein HY405_02330 [Candidatus Microgenomates bacterium]|nr:hypothetical protein [Candidatus Microgenomates bacterium]